MDRPGQILARLTHVLRLDRLPKGIRRIIVAVVGGTILLIGLALVFLPGPAIVVIPIGLVILASEFAWARWCLKKAQAFWGRAHIKAAGRQKAPDKPPQLSARE